VKTCSSRDAFDMMPLVSQISSRKEVHLCTKFLVSKVEGHLKPCVCVVAVWHMIEGGVGGS
jgi:hypothetical protein